MTIPIHWLHIFSPHSMPKQSISEMIDEVCDLTAKLNDLNDELKSLTKEFEDRPEVQQLSENISLASESVTEARNGLMERMKKENMESAATDLASVSLSRVVLPAWEDDEKLFTLILENDDFDELREHIKTSPHIVDKRAFKKALKEVMELEEPEEMKEVGVELTEDYRITVRTKDND